MAQSPPDDVDLPISSETLADIVLLARAYDAEVEVVDPDEGSNAADDRNVDALEARRSNPTGRELTEAIRDLDVDAQAALVALAWIGREDFEPAEWKDALTAARERREGPTWRYLMGLPMLGDLIEDGADQLGISLTEDEQIALHHPLTEEPSEDDRD
ncbi:MAG: DUF3775 domain-containing protein [Pseudomonadota bacterium]